MVLVTMTISNVLKRPEDIHADYNTPTTCASVSIAALMLRLLFYVIIQLFI
jgi:hypothetical protein